MKKWIIGIGVPVLLGLAYGVFMSEILVPDTDTFTVRYDVYGASEAKITYSNSNYGTNQVSVMLPWHKEISVKGNHPLVLSVQGELDEEYQAHIFVNGKEKGKSSGKGIIMVSAAAF
jgi:hypothetical protein